MLEKKKILVAMSGGVDSSVAAALLVNAGYDVTGMFAVNYEDTSLPGESCWRGDYNDALRVSAKLKIPLLRLNFVKEYKKHVLDYMYREYRIGRTPNPDVLCNKFVKFGVWLKKAKELGFDKIATGHYAILSPLSFPHPLREYKLQRESSLKLLTAKDDNKDQTYFLHQLTQAQLKHVLFPVGKYTKPQVRALADKYKLPTAKKEESMGICFVGEVPMKKFLMKKIKTKKGKIIFSSGEVAGVHDGLAFYTIGERIAVACHSRPDRESSRDGAVDPRFHGDDNGKKPFYVVGKNTKKNELIVGNENDPMLFSREMKAKDINWVAGRAPKFPLKCEVRLRHRQALQKCHCEELPQGVTCLPAGRRGNLIVKFAQPQRAVTPGQFAVFYVKGVCLGGGVIV